MNREERKRNQPKLGKLVGLAIVLLATAPQLAILLGIIAGAIYLVTQASKTKARSDQMVFELPKFERPKLEQPGFGKTKQSDFDDRPKELFCFHKDKGEHHVSRGREIDPWDRPDIDIRKYQRK